MYFCMVYYPSDRHILLDIDLLHPFGLMLHEDYVYWTDQKAKSVQRANKFDGLDRRIIIKNVDNLQDIHVFHRNRSEPG